VQDLPEVEASFTERIPEDKRNRISFEPHDFFKPQQTKGDVYILKTILHDWPDKYAAQILKHLVTHLETGSRLLLVEAIAPPDITQLPFNTLARMMGAADFQMLNAFNSLERSIDDWKGLLAKVDERLEITYTSLVPGSLHNFIEIQIRA
jgi:hypothetical protein